jgi:hypothetical protein
MVSTSKVKTVCLYAHLHEMTSFTDTELYFCPSATHRMCRLIYRCEGYFQVGSVGREVAFPASFVLKGMYGTGCRIGPRAILNIIGTFKRRCISFGPNRITLITISMEICFTVVYAYLACRGDVMLHIQKYDANHRASSYYIRSSVKGSLALAQLMQLLTAFPSRRPRFDPRSSCGICARQSGPGASYFRILRLLLPIIIPPNAPHSFTIIISRGLVLSSSRQTLE